MKKYTFLFAVIASLALAACGSGSATSETTDSVAAQVDSGAVSAVDSTTAQIPAEGGSAQEGKTDIEKPVSNEAVK